MSELKVTGVKEIPKWAWFHAITVSTILTDAAGNKYQADIELDKGWTRDDMIQSIKASMQMCEYEVVACHVDSAIKTPRNVHKN